MITLLMAGLFVQEVPSLDGLHAQPLRTIDDAVVVGGSPRPGAMSGVFAVWAHIDVEDARGGRHRMFLIFLRRDQFIPPINSRCRITFERARISGISYDRSVDGRTLHNRVEELVCDTGSWSSRSAR